MIRGKCCRVGFENERVSPERKQLGFGAETSSVHALAQEKHHRFGGGFYANGEQDRGQQRLSQLNPRPLDEWRGAQIAGLAIQDLEFDRITSSSVAEPSPRTGSGGRDSAWWEKERGKRSSGASSRQPSAGVSMPQYDGPYEEEAKLFRPPLFLKCGPLLRYTGVRREESGREIWRGSVMIVTEDGQCDYSSVPTLRLFAQPMELFQPPTKEMLQSGHEIPPEYEDPVAGQVKVSRTGRPLYVRPVHELPLGVDLSREENNQGLYAATRTPVLGPQSTSGPGPYALFCWSCSP